MLCPARSPFAHPLAGWLGGRKELVFAWFAGDIFKTAFFLFRRAPLQFVLCGLIQLVVDAAVALQMRIYADNNGPSVAVPRHLQASRSKRAHHLEDSLL